MVKPPGSHRYLLGIGPSEKQIVQIDIQIGERGDVVAVEDAPLQPHALWVLGAGCEA